MAETYGRKWYTVPMDKLLSPSYCTIGKSSNHLKKAILIYIYIYNLILILTEYANTHKLQQDHACAIRSIRNNYSNYTKFGNTVSISALLTLRLTGQGVSLFYAITHV
jgi:hypothetical protein